MSTIFAGPYVPVGYDPGFPFDSSPDEDIPALLYDFDHSMTQTYPAVSADDFNFWRSHSPTSSRHDVAKTSPGRDSDQAPAASQGSASLSPAGPVYTPTSTLLDYDEDITAEHAGFDDASTSPESNRFSADDYVHVHGPDDDVCNGSDSLTTQPPRPSGLTSPPHLASASSQPLVLSTTNPTAQHLQWQRMSCSPPNTSMEDNFMPYTSSADLGVPVASWAEADLLSSASDFSATFPDHTYDMSFGTLTHGSFHQRSSTSNAMGLSSQQALALQGQASTSSPFLDPAFQSSSQGAVQESQQQAAVHFNEHFYTQRTPDLSQSPSNLVSQPPPQQALESAPVQGHPQSRRLNVPVPPTNVSVATAPTFHSTKTQQQRSHLDYSSASRLPSLGARRKQRQPSTPHTPSPSAVQTSRPLVKRDPGHSTNGLIRPAQADRVKRGGRQRDSHLSTETRQKSHEMRKKGACWRCAMQRDQVSFTLLNTMFTSY